MKVTCSLTMIVRLVTSTLAILQLSFLYSSKDTWCAWVGGVTHVIDTGAVGPGSMSNGQIQRFGDGLQITCRKTGVNDTPLRDWLHESQRNVRTVKYWILDEKTRIAGTSMIREMVQETIADEGVEAWDVSSQTKLLKMVAVV